MTHAFDMRHATVEGILSTGNFQTARQRAAKDAGRCTVPAWVSETKVQSRNLWRLPAVHR